MKRNYLILAGISLIGIILVGNIGYSYNNYNLSNNWYSSIVASDSTGSNGSDGSNGSAVGWQNCGDVRYAYNYMIGPSGTHSITAKTDKNGEISLSYKDVSAGGKREKNTFYEFKWGEKECKDSPGNCCDQHEVGWHFLGTD